MVEREPGESQEGDGTPEEREAARLRASVPPRVSLPRRLARSVVARRRATILALEIDPDYPAIERDDVTLHWLSDPADPLVDLLDKPEVVRAALLRGDAVNVAMAGETFASRLGVCLGTFREPFMGVKIHLRTGTEAWLGEAHTEPEFRRRGLAFALGADTMHRLSAMGVHTLYGSVEDWNVASRQAGLAQGYVPIAEFGFLRVLRRVGLPLPRSASPAVPPLVGATPETASASTLPSMTQSAR